MSEDPDALQVPELPKYQQINKNTKIEEAIILNPPDYLQIKNSENMAVEWETWLQQYEWFETASNLKKKNKKMQVATFMSIIGSEAISIYNTFRLSKIDQKNLQVIKEKFSEYFIPKTNVTCERFMFFKREYKTEETIDDYVRALRLKIVNLVN